jgi:hypothetical protein
MPAQTFCKAKQERVLVRATKPSCVAFSSSALRPVAFPTSYLILALPGARVRPVQHYDWRLELGADLGVRVAHAGHPRSLSDSELVAAMMVIMPFHVGQAFEGTP